MGTEIERKFLTRDDTWRAKAVGVPFRQGYLSTDPARVVRVRTMGERGVITLKSQRQGLVRGEWEYSIPKADAVELLDTLCLPPLIEKTRFHVRVGAHLWEVDEFAGENRGLVVAEIELEEPDEPFVMPPWAGDEVSDDPRYLNANLARQPYSTWAKGPPP
jgi:adenylate cyclase